MYKEAVKSLFVAGFKEQIKPISLRNAILWTLLLGMTEGKLSDRPRSLPALFSVILHPGASSAKDSVFQPHMVLLKC